jgi:hypothetical protein
MNDINARVAALRMTAQKRAKMTSQPQQYQPPTPQPQNPNIAGLARRFIAWATASGTRPQRIATTPGTRWFKRGTSLEGWVLCEKQTPLTEDPNFSYAGSYTMIYAVTTDGRVTWHSVQGGTPPGSISWKVPRTGSDEGIETTSELIANYIVRSGSQVPFPD